MASKKKYVPNPECCNPFKNHGRMVQGAQPISRRLSERDPSLGLRVGNKHVRAGPTTSSSSETQEMAGPSTVGVVEALEANISTLNT